MTELESALKNEHFSSFSDNCQRQKKSQEQRLKEKSKSNFKQDKIMQFKNKNTRTKNKNTRCARQMWKQIFIMLACANINMKITW